MDGTRAANGSQEGGLVSSIKLKAGEAQHLAALIIAVARPRSADEARELEQWIKRLQGGR